MAGIRNVNVGVLGHVDVGKTALCKALSSVASTAAFDRNPQSKERGITLDLGFSAMRIGDLQFTFVDCPGHASLIRTVIGGAQIINFMILVIDVTKGLQPQTIECIVIAKITCPRMIIVLNKIDKLDVERRQSVVQRMSEKFRKTLEDKGLTITAIIPVSATEQENLTGLQTAMLQAVLPVATPDSKSPLLFSVDHCFTIRGKGTICTGTVLEGRLRVGDTVEIPQLGNCHRTVKSIEMFRQPLEQATKGDRLGICISQFDSKQMERGLLCSPASVPFCYCGVLEYQPVDFYRGSIRSKAKFHVSVGHSTVLATVCLFKGAATSNFHVDGFYEYVDEIEKDSPHKYYVILEFEKPILWTPNCLVICSRLDLEFGNNHHHQQTGCRLAFHGNIIAGSSTQNCKDNFLSTIKLYRNKCKFGSIQRVVNEREIVVEDFFRKMSNRDAFVGLKINLSSGQTGRIESTFGKTSKVKITLDEVLTQEQIQNVKQIEVILMFKKLLFSENKRIFQ